MRQSGALLEIRGQITTSTEGIRVFDSQEHVFQVNGKSIDVGIVHLPHEWME